MKCNPYLMFDGHCEEAFKFYARCLGGEIVMMMKHAGSPAADQVPPEWQDKILHARLVAGDVVLMASDAPPGRQEKPQGFSVSLLVDTPEQAERIFKALSENATIRMPMG